MVDRFVADFLTLLDTRLDDIGDRVRLGDEKRAVVALLSLECSAAMIGAEELVDQLRALRSVLRDARTADLAPLLSGVRTTVEGLRRALQERVPA